MKDVVVEDVDEPQAQQIDEVPEKEQEAAAPRKVEVAAFDQDELARKLREQVDRDRRATADSAGDENGKQETQNDFGYQYDSPRD